MDANKTGICIALLRRQQGLTQLQLAQKLHVSPQAVSKWETGAGSPDIALLAQLAEIFGVSMTRLLQGDLTPNMPEVGNMKRLKFYACPQCGNLLTSAGGGELHCCGRKLEPMEPKAMNEDHSVKIETVEDEWYVTFSHPMEKQHYFRFAAFVGTERVLMVRLYPEQGGEFRVPQMRRAKLYLCCSRDGLYRVDL